MSGKYSEWHRGAEVFNSSINESESGETVQLTVEVVSRETDYLTIQAEPFTESITVMSLEKIKCKPQKTEISDLVHLKAAEEMCLRKLIPGIMQFDNTLELSFEKGTEVFQNSDLFATIELQSNLCIDKCWIDQLYYLSVDSTKRYIYTTPHKMIYHRDKFVCPSNRATNLKDKYSCHKHEEAYKNIHNRWQMCNASNYNYGQDKLIWKMNITSVLLQNVGDISLLLFLEN